MNRPSSHPGSSPPSRPPGRWAGRVDGALLAAIAFLFAGYLSGPQLRDPDRFHDNWRQSPCWVNPAQQRFQSDDILIRYTRFNNSPFSSLLYTTISAHHGDAIRWGKIIGLLYFTLTAVGIYVTGCALSGRVSGWTAAVVWLFFPCVFKDFPGGFESALTYLLLALTVLAVHQRRWMAAGLLVVCESFIYPPAMVQSAMLVALDVLLTDRRTLGSGRFWREKGAVLLLAAVLACGVLKVRYAGMRHGFGHVTNRVEIDHRVEFTRAGRSNILPVPSLWERVCDYWADGFHVTLFLCAVLVLGKKTFRLPRGLYALLGSAVVLYWLADVFLLRLYFPERYVRRALPVFAALTAGWWMSALAARWSAFRAPPRPATSLEERSLFPALVGLLLAVGLTCFTDTYRPGQHTVRYARHELYAALRRLPDRPLIAAYPRVASELPLLTGKSVLVAMELSHPWWTEYWKVIDRRTRDFFRAYYAKDPETIRAFLDKYPVDYVLVDRRYYAPRTLGRRRVYMEPFNSWVFRNLDPWQGNLLAQVPPRYHVFDDGRFFLVAAPDLRDWLTTRAGVRSGNSSPHP